MPVLEVSDHESLVEHLVRIHPAVVFLDLELPGLGGITGVAALQRVDPPMKMVLLSDVPNQRDALFALVAGARGYCARDLDAALILKATEVVQQGEVWIGRHVIPYLLRKLASLSLADPAEPAPGLGAALDVLAPREREIALLVGAGRNNKEIALRLNISESTVKAHLTSVYRKMNVPDRLRLGLFVTGGMARTMVERVRPSSDHVGGSVPSRPAEV